MATRLYLNSFAVRPQPDRPSWDAGWTQTHGSGRFGTLLPDVHPITGQGNTSYTNTAQAGPANFGVWGCVSAMLASDQTISGTLSGQIMLREGHASANAMANISVRVLAPDGSIRGTLLALHTASLTQELSTTSRNAKVPYDYPTSLSSLACYTYDRILIEVGVRKHEAGTTGRQYQVRNGSDGTTGDLPADETTTATTYNPWFEFSQDLDLLEVPNINTLTLMGAGA